MMVKTSIQDLPNIHQPDQFDLCQGHSTNRHFQWKSLGFHPNLFNLNIRIISHGFKWLGFSVSMSSPDSLQLDLLISICVIAARFSYFTSMHEIYSLSSNGRYSVVGIKVSHCDVGKTMKLSIWKVHQERLFSFNNNNNNNNNFNNEQPFELCKAYFWWICLSIN